MGNICSGSTPKEEEEKPKPKQDEGFNTQPALYSTRLAVAVARDDLAGVKDLIAQGNSANGRKGFDAEQEAISKREVQKGDHHNGETSHEPTQNEGEESNAVQDTAVFDTTGSREGMSMVHIAASHNSFNVLRYLLSAESQLHIDPRLKDATGSGSTPLHHAASGDAKDAARVLVNDFKVDPNIEDSEGHPPLHYASYNDSTDFVRVLVNELKANPNYQGHGGQPPIFSATQGSAYATFVVLVKELGASLHTTITVVDLQSERKQGLLEFAQLWVHDDEDNSILNFLLHPLRSAIEQDDDKWLAKLVDRQLEASFGGDHVAQALVTKFLQGRVGFESDENKDGLELLHFAARCNAFKCCKLLSVKYKADAATLGWGSEVGSVITQSTPLHLAAGANALGAVQVLVQEGGVDPRILDGQGYPPVHRAALADHVDIVSGMVEHYGADPTELWDSLGQCAIMSAIQGDAVRVFKYLTSTPPSGASPKVPLLTASPTGVLNQPRLFTFNSKEQTALQWATEYKAWGIVLSQGGVAPTIAARMERAVRADDVDTVRRWYQGKVNQHRDPRELLFPLDEDTVKESSILHLAAASNAGRVLHYLLSGYCSEANGTTTFSLNPDAPDASDSHCPPLHHAALDAAMDTARILVVDYHCDPNLLDAHGSPPLHYAAYNDHTDFVRMMVNELKADLNFGGTGGYQPLLFSAAQGNAVATVRCMIEELGCNPEVTMEHLDASNNPESVQTLKECAAQWEATAVTAYLEGGDTRGSGSTYYSSAASSTSRGAAQEVESKKEEKKDAAAGMTSDVQQQQEEDEEDEWTLDEESGYLYGSRCGLYYDEESECYYDPDADVWMDADGNVVPDA